MKLTTITARNFKGLSFTLALSDINFLVGSNFAGKTARTDAIRFLLLGYLPELGKTNTASFGLSSGREMTVAGTFDNGLEISRTLRLEGNSVKAINTIPKEIEDCGQLAVMLNAETYFALSDRARVDYVFANVQMGPEWTVEGIISQVKEPAIANKLTLIAHGLTPQGFVDAALELLTAEAKTTKAHATKMEQTVQGLSALRADDDPTGALVTIEATRKLLTDELAHLHAQKGEHQATYDAAKAATRRRGELQAQLAQRPAIETKRAITAYRLETAGLEMTQHTTVSTVVMEAALRQEQEIVRKAATLESQMRYIETAMIKTHASLDEINDRTSCPYCGATGDGWKVLRRAELEPLLAEQIANKTALAKAMVDLAAEAERVQTEIAGYREKNHRYIVAEKEVTALKQTMAHTIHALAAMDIQQQALADLPREDPAVVTAVEMAQSAINVTNQKLATLETERRQAISRQGELKRLADAETQRDQAKEELATLVTAGKALREIQGKMVQAAFEPLLQRANSFFADVLKTPIAYHEGEIGTWRAGCWVTHRTFSGTEKLLTYAAIQAALAAKSPVRIMLLDELGRVDQKNLDALVTSLDHAITTGYLDQLVGIDATDRFRAEGFTQRSSQIVRIQ